MIVRALSACSILLAAAARADDLPFEKRAKDLAGANPTLVELSNIGKSRQGRTLHVLKLSDGPGDKPSLVIVAGINAMHRVGTDVAVGVAEQIIADHKDLLKTANVYIVPCVNPDTAAWLRDAGHPKTDWSRTIEPLDQDRDGRVNEDPAEDVNGDGVISLMRIKNPKPGSGLKAEYCVDPENPKLLKKPDASKGERAEYALLVEGTDNDGDGKFNEDGVGGAGGGVDPDMNFPYRWPEQWTDGAGRYPLCEPETLALVQWMLKLKNIAAVLVYGPGDTLVSIPQVGKFDQTQQVPLGIEEGDKAAYEEFSKLFKEATHQTGAPTVDMAGSFWGWCYAEYGVFSLETPVWVRPDLVKKEEKKDAEKKEGEKKEGGGEKPAAPDAAEMTPEQIRARMQQFADATPEQRAKMMEEFQNLPQGVRDRMLQRAGGGQPPAGGPPAAGAQPTPGGPGARPGGGGGGGGRRGGGLGRGGGPPGGGAGGGEADAGKKPAEPGGDDAKWLKYDDELVKAGATSGFLDWKPFKHPQLGEIEVGGFVPGFKLNPPDSELPRLAQEQAKFVESLCAKFPRIVAEPAVVKREGASLWRIFLRATNEGALATMAAIGVKSRRDLPTILTIDVPIERIVSGEKMVRAWTIAGNGGKAEAEWMITGEAGSTVNVEVRGNIGGKTVVPVKLEEVAR